MPTLPLLAEFSTFVVKFHDSDQNSDYSAVVPLRKKRIGSSIPKVVTKWRVSQQFLPEYNVAYPVI